MLRDLFIFVLKKIKKLVCIWPNLSFVNKWHGIILHFYFLSYERKEKKSITIVKLLFWISSGNFLIKKMLKQRRHTQFTKQLTKLIRVTYASVSAFSCIFKNRNRQKNYLNKKFYIIIINACHALILTERHFFCFFFIFCLFL